MTIYTKLFTPLNRSDYIQLMDIYRPLTSSYCKMLLNLVSRKVLTHHYVPLCRITPLDVFCHLITKCVIGAIVKSGSYDYFWCMTREEKAVKPVGKDLGSVALSAKMHISDELACHPFKLDGFILTAHKVAQHKTSYQLPPAAPDRDV